VDKELDLFPTCRHVETFNSAELYDMDGNAHCLWCDKTYFAANPPAVESSGICWDCIQLVFPGIFDASDREKLYGTPSTPLRSTELGRPEKT